MKVFFSTEQLLHRPQQYMVAGRFVPHLDVPARAEKLLASVSGATYEILAPADFGIEPVALVHERGYLDFLAEGWARWSSAAGAGPELLANLHGYRGAGEDFAPRAPLRSRSPIAQAGWYMGDLACGLGEGTYRAALASANCALAAAEAVLAGESVSYALCRPPGHQAAADRAAGFCFLNNVAIAAERMLSRSKRVAILDVDAHHGGGTQAIFYRRSDVQFCSVHTDPSNYYPYYSGYADEYGAGAGMGFNLNLPLAPGSGDAEFLDALDDAFAAIRAHGAEALLVSVGFDAHHLDPLSALKVTTDGYRRIGECIGGLRLPTVIVQEGGFALDQIGRNLVAFLHGFLFTHGD